jgi:hypothetical protein
MLVIGAWHVLFVGWAMLCLRASGIWRDVWLFQIGKHVGPQDRDPVCHAYSAAWFHYKVTDDHIGLYAQGNLCNTCARTMDASYPCYTVNELAQAKSLRKRSSRCLLGRLWARG